MLSFRASGRVSSLEASLGSRRKGSGGPTRLPAIASGGDDMRDVRSGRSRPVPVLRGLRTSIEAVAPAGVVRKTVTLVFSDIVGSTAMGEGRDPEAVRGAMDRYFAEMRQIVERHGGIVEKFVGDAVMAAFRIPLVHEDDALRAVRTAAEMRGRLAVLNEELERDWGLRLDARIGVNTGEVVAGDPSSRQSFATGDTVNTAARLEQAAPTNEILLSAATLRLVRHAVQVEPVEPLTLKGKAEPMLAFRLVAVDPLAVGRARRTDLGLVGRQRDLSALQQMFESRRCRRLPTRGRCRSRRSRQVPAAGGILRVGRRTCSHPPWTMPVVRGGDHVLPDRRGRSRCRGHHGSRRGRNRDREAPGGRGA